MDHLSVKGTKTIQDKPFGGKRRGGGSREREKEDTPTETKTSRGPDHWQDHGPSTGLPSLSCVLLGCICLCILAWCLPCFFFVVKIEDMNTQVEALDKSEYAEEKTTTFKKAWIIPHINIDMDRSEDAWDSLFKKKKKRTELEKERERAMQEYSFDDVQELQQGMWGRYQGG